MHNKKKKKKKHIKLGISRKNELSFIDNFTFEWKPKFE